MAHFVLLLRVVIVLILTDHAESQGCKFPEYFKGEYFSIEDGINVKTVIDDKKWGDLECGEKFDHLKPDPRTDGANHTFLVKNLKNGEFLCLDVLWRTPNVLQFRKGDSIKNTSIIHVKTTCDGVTVGLPVVDSLETMFKTTDPAKINYKSTFEGIFQFTYEYSYGGGGICDNPESQIQACYTSVSSYIDNEVIRMKYAKCRDVVTSIDKIIRYQCFGTWFAMRNGIGYTYAVVADTIEKDQAVKFKCLMTIKNQKKAFNKDRWVMSQFAYCKHLNSLYDGPVRLVLTKIPPATTYLTPKCNLPCDFNGTWLTQGLHYQSNIKVNDTHIYFFTPKNEFEYQETYYSCQRSWGTRYLMSKVVVGKCEVYFTCLDITARRHSIVKYREGKPFKYQQTSSPSTEEEIFREACSWKAFTFDRDDYAWKYETMILNPPSPVACPIAGRYTFSQTVLSPLEKFQTCFHGFTDKPSLQDACKKWVTEFKTCSDNITNINVNGDYCESVDSKGTPIGEYDEPDKTLTCVGFWMEDVKSYLVTWDIEDTISPFRCWVYERKSWTGVYMSRAQNARCPREQTAISYMIPGTGLALDLTESERLFDDCPRKFDPGAVLYNEAIISWVSNKAGNQLPTLYTLIATIVTSVCSKLMHL